MRSWFKVRLAWAVAAVLGLSSVSVARADVFLFDPDGAPGGLAPVSVRTFDLSPGNALAKDSVPGISMGATNFRLLFQAKMSALLNATNNPIGGIIGPVEYTLTADFPELGTPTGPNSVVFSLGAITAGAPNNIVRLFYDATPDANDATGAGFADGTEILRGRVISIDNAGFVLTGTTDPDLAANNTTDTVVGSGSQDLTVLVEAFDAGFFGAGVVPTSLVFSTRSSTPFVLADASASVVGQAPNLGMVNGQSGPDFLLESDAAFAVSVIPEPSTMILLGVGLGSVGLRRLVRRRQLAMA
jgi:hypothetical protein